MRLQIRFRHLDGREGIGLAMALRQSGTILPIGWVVLIFYSILEVGHASVFVHMGVRVKPSAKKNKTETGAKPD